MVLNSILLSNDSHAAQLARQPHAGTLLFSTDDTRPHSEESNFVAKILQAKRINRKQELPLLRQRVRELERRLQSLTSVSTLPSDTISELLWKDIARRQHERRLLSEAENRRLKKLIVKKKLALQQLSNLLGQCSELDVIHTPRQPRTVKMPAKWNAKELSKAKRYSLETASEFERVDFILNRREPYKAEAHQYTSTDDQLFSTTTCFPPSNDRSALNLHFRSKFMMPFPFERVSAAAWAATKTLIVRIDSASCIQEDHDQMLAKVEDAEGIFRYSAVGAFRRFSDKPNTRVVIICRSSCSEADNHEHVVTEETSWCVVEHVNDNSTLVQMCVHALPTPQGPGDDSLTKISQKLGSETIRGFAAFKCAIENSLVDEDAQYDMELRDSS